MDKQKPRENEKVGLSRVAYTHTQKEGLITKGLASERESVAQYFR